MGELNDGGCLGIQFEDESTTFVVDECEAADARNVGTWREVVYKREANWMQIENYGDVGHPIYMVLAAVDDDSFCKIGSEIEMRSAVFEQDIENDEWISKQTQFEYDVNVDKIRLIGCDDTEVEKCVSTSQDEEGNVDLFVAGCDDAT